MTLKIMYATGLFLVVAIAVAVGAFLLPSGSEVSAQQDRGWKVWVKTSPCSGRFDWVTVAKENPTYGGGGSFWQNADLIMTGTGMSCVRAIDQSCSKAQATAEAITVRGSNKFSNYCCREYSVWQHIETKKMSIVVGKFGTAGLGWNKVRGDLCCEEAESFSGLTGACSGNQGGTSTGFGPVSGSSLQGTTLTFYPGTTPEKCQADCGANAGCNAFTLIKAGAYTPGAPAMCYLISAVTASANSSCCISAIKNVAGSRNSTTGDDLSGTWVGSYTGNGCSARGDLTLRRASPIEWEGSLVTTILQCDDGSGRRESSAPRAVKLLSVGGGKAKATYAGPGAASELTYTANQILWSGWTFTRR
jgi:hypothetical protein